MNKFCVIILQASNTSINGALVGIFLIFGVCLVLYLVIKGGKNRGGKTNTFPENDTKKSETLKCPKCGSESINISKKGFNVVSAFGGFLIIGLILLLLWWVLSQQSDYIYFKNSSNFKLLEIALICLPIAGLLFGAVDMNILQITCLNCGNKKNVG
jgi:hypothetical protein